MRRRLMIRRDDSYHIISAPGCGEDALVCIQCYIMINIFGIQVSDNRYLAVVLSYL